MPNFKPSGESAMRLPPLSLSFESFSLSLPALESLLLLSAFFRPVSSALPNRSARASGVAITEIPTRDVAANAAHSLSLMNVLLRSFSGLEPHETYIGRRARSSGRSLDGLAPADVQLPSFVLLGGAPAPPS